MSISNYEHQRNYSRWFQGNFLGKAVANIRIHLNDREIKSYLKDDFHAAIAREFENNYSRHFYKGVEELVEWQRLSSTATENKVV